MMGWAVLKSLIIRDRDQAIGASRLPPKHLWLGGNCFVSFLHSFSIPVKIPFLQSEFSRKSHGEVGSMEFVDARLASILYPVVVSLSFGISWGNLEKNAGKWARPPEIMIWLDWGGACVSVLF